MTNEATRSGAGARDTLWLRLPPQRPVVSAHLRHVAGRFRAAGWRAAVGLTAPSELGGALAVMDDPWTEPLPAVASFLARADAPVDRWRVPLVNGLELPQGWETKTGPYTAREYERSALDIGSAAVAMPAGAAPWCGFAVAAAGQAAALLNSGWPPESRQVTLIPQARVFRYRDPAGHDRTELDRFIPRDAAILVDVGCGQGRLGARHRLPGRWVIGIEPDRKLAGEAALRLDLVLPVTAERGLAALRPDLDCVVFADVLEHLADPSTALGAAASLLAPHGRIVASLPNAAWAPVLRALAGGRWDPTMAGVQARDHLAPMTPASFRRLAAECGLRVVEEVAMTAPLSRWLRCWAWLVARSSGGRPSDLLTPQWIAVLERRRQWTPLDW